MPSGDLLDEHSLRAADVLDRLARHWRWRKSEEVTWVAGGERHPDLAVWLHAAYPRSMASARIDDDDRRLGRIDSGADRGNNARKAVVDRPLQSAAVPHKFYWKVEHMRDLLRGVLMVVVASFTQRVEEQYAALPCVRPIFPRCAEAGHLIRHTRLRSRFELCGGRLMPGPDKRGRVLD